MVSKMAQHIFDTNVIDHNASPEEVDSALQYVAKLVDKYPCLLCERKNPNGFVSFVPAHEFADRMPAGPITPGKLRICAHMLCRVCAERHTTEELNEMIDDKFLTRGRCHAVVLDIGRHDLTRN